MISVGPSALPDLHPTIRNTDKKAWSKTQCLCGWYTTLHLHQTYQSTKMENCLTDINTWMSQNKLKLNADKTEVVVMGTPQMRAKTSNPSNTVIVPVPNKPVGNLGAVFDPNKTMSAHVSKVIKSAKYHLRNIGKIRIFLNTDTTKSAIVSLVTSVIYIFVESLMSYYAGTRKSKTMPLEWLMAPKIMIIFQPITGCPSGKGLSSRFCLCLLNGCKDVIVPLYIWANC